MGNEGSHLKGLEIDERPVETTDFWSHYHATIKDSCRYFSLKSDGSVSVYRGEPSVTSPLWNLSSPLEKYSNNLLKYRHPCIVRYISAWQQKSILHLATEYVQPLTHVLRSQTPLQICIGLNNILRALVFLHEQAGMSHNNVSLSAIYVSGDGQWKLGGLQYMTSFNELTSSFLKQARIHRYDKAVDPNEESSQPITKVDHYAYAVLVEDAFKECDDDEVPHLKEFKKYCNELLQHNDPLKRPQLSDVLQHNFFNHDFISIYKFLNFLPLKTDEEKHDFFSNVLDSLKCYNEETVAKQFSGLLLSRLTMLDPTARANVIPSILKPRNERQQNNESTGFFSLDVFKEHFKPRLLQLFAVRDIQIRMLLLTHFTKFVHAFTHEELSQQILPDLLLGIKDTDDHLVASTLICLSELVPILGANTVVGGKRCKLFSDGRPKLKANLSLTSGLQKDFAVPEHIYQIDNRVLNLENTIALNERPSPVGGEAIENELIPDSNVKSLPETDDDWDDWDNTNRVIAIGNSFNIANQEVNDDINQLQEDSSMLNVASERKIPEQHSVSPTMLQKAAIEAKKNILDISELDIKNQKYEVTKKVAEEIDFFADMMPVIEKQAVVNIISNENGESSFSSKLNFVPDETENWGDNWDE